MITHYKGDDLLTLENWPGATTNNEARARAAAGLAKALNWGGEVLSMTEQAPIPYCPARERQLV